MRTDVIASVVTDPPGEHRDGGTWVRDAFDLLPPGGHLVAPGTHRLACAAEDVGFEIRDSILYLLGRVWEGVVLARKPLEGTVAANVLAHGTGAINVDGSRIGTRGGGTNRPWKSDPEAVATRGERAKTAIDKANDMGRWPANVILGCACEGPGHDPECAVALLDAQSGELASGGGVRNGAKESGVYGAYAGDDPPRGFPANTGGASRFFYEARSRAALLAYLRKLVTPDGWLSLDPFGGLTPEASPRIFPLNDEKEEPPMVPKPGERVEPRLTAEVRPAPAVGLYAPQPTPATRDSREERSP